MIVEEEQRQREEYGLEHFLEYLGNSQNPQSDAECSGNEPG